MPHLPKLRQVASVTSAIRIWRTTLAAESHPSCLVDPEEVDVPVEVAGYRGEHTVPPIEGGLVGDAAQLGRTLDGNVRRMSLMKEIQTGSGFRQCSRTVPVGEVNLLPQQRQRHLETPAAVDPFLQTPPAPHSWRPGSGR